jgi:hypothetical protein
MDAAAVGHNKPPEALDFAPETMAALSAWMAEHPAIQTEDDAREAKKLLDRARGCTGDIEAERVKQVWPLNEQVNLINATYKAVHNTDSRKPGTLDKVTNELKARLATYISAEEERRWVEAEAKRLAAKEAERQALAAAVRQADAIDNARAGELGVDVTQVVVDAAALVNAAEKALRASAIADKETNVKIGGGWGKALSLRTKETLIVEDAYLALHSIGLDNETIRAAILTAAREYRKAHGKLPAGVTSITERNL